MGVFLPKAAVLLTVLCLPMLAFASNTKSSKMRDSKDTWWEGEVVQYNGKEYEVAQDAKGLDVQLKGLSGGPIKVKKFNCFNTRQYYSDSYVEELIKGLNVGEGSRRHSDPEKKYSDK